MRYYSLNIQGKVVRETQAARLVKVIVGSQEVETWFPKSQCRMKTNTDMEIPEWLLSDKESKLGGPIHGIK